MNYKIAQTLSPVQFKRRFGVRPNTFKQIVKALKPAWRTTPKPGVKPKLGIEDRVLVCLSYWREYGSWTPMPWHQAKAEYEKQFLMSEDLG